MTFSITAALCLGLLAAIPPICAADQSLHYKLRARVTGPQDDATPKVDGWPVEVQRLGVTTRLPPDYMWGVLYNTSFSPSRGGDVFYTQRTAADDDTIHTRTDAPNNSGEVTPFGWVVGEGGLVGATMFATRYISVPPETVTDVAIDGDGVPFLQKPAFEQGTFVACTGLYGEWATLSWIDVSKDGTDPIYKNELQNCTAIELVPEYASDGPTYGGLEEGPCVADFWSIF